MSFAGDGTYVGISGQRPTAGIGSGTRFIDRATGDESYWNGSTWIQSPRSVFSGSQITGSISGSPSFQGLVTFSGGTSPAFQLSGSAAAGIRSPHDYLIYKNSANATVYCLDSDGSVITSSTTQEAPLQVALSSGLRKSIYVTAGTYNLSAGFTGFNFTQVETKLIMDPGALINVPNGYSGAVFTYHAPVSVTQTIGGRISEQGTPASLWTAYHLLADTSGDGVNSNRISDGYIRYANKVIHLHTNHATGWVNSNSIQNIFADRFVHGIYFDEEVAPTGSNGTNANVFYNIILQAHPTDPQTLNGVRGITGADNQFYAVMVWDLFDPGVSANVTSGADNTLIVGGAMCHLNYTNFGVDTHVFEQSAGLVTDKLTLANKRYSYKNTSNKL